MAYLLLALVLLTGYATSAPDAAAPKNECRSRYGFCNPYRERIDAGYCGIEEQECSDKGFCWANQPSGDYEEAYCFYPNTYQALDPLCEITDPDMRSNCGYGPQSACEDRGCCWAPLPPDVAGPWCYHPMPEKTT